MQLLFVLVVAVFLGGFGGPKTKAPKPQEVKAPVVKEGKRIRKIYGTVWVDDSMVLGFKKIGTDAIRKSGGKK